MGILRLLVVVAFIVNSISSAIGQIDPEKRDLLQLGYNQAIEGKGPISGYAFYYLNRPGFIESNLTLRAAIAPTYIDSELGIAHAISQYTDLGIGLSGGGFGDSYNEIRGGKLFREESFTGHGGEVSVSAYHLFNPGQRIPLNAVIRAGIHYAMYERDSHTSPGFQLPADGAETHLRAGIRFGGSEPLMTPDLAMELSVWYEGQYRANSGLYGYSGDRQLNDDAHLFWARGLLAYTFPKSGQKFSVNITAGTSVNADRFSAYRIGGVLPLVSEFPLNIPGYYYQELSAKSMVLISGQYTVPLDSKNRWQLTAMGTVAQVDYVQGTAQPGNDHQGIGVGLGYRSPKGNWQGMVYYGYGFEAERDHGRGAQNIGFLCQWDFQAKHHPAYLDSEGPNKSRGLFHLLDHIGP